MIRLLRALPALAAMLARLVRDPSLPRGVKIALGAAVVYLAYVLTPVTWLFGPTTAWVLLPWLTLPLATGVVRIVRSRSDGPVAGSIG